jgi:hypothetical protein
MSVWYPTRGRRPSLPYEDGGQDPARMRPECLRFMPDVSVDSPEAFKFGESWERFEKEILHLEEKGRISIYGR